MLGKEFKKLVESIPDDFEVRAVAAFGPHAQILGVVNQDKDQRSAIMIAMKVDPNGSVDDAEIRGVN